MHARAPYYFLHIPKTAGTSAISWLRECDRFSACPHQIWSLLLAADRASLSQYDLFYGHLYRYLPDYLGRAVNVFTFIRHPVERAYSHYRHVLRDTNHYFHEQAVRGKTFLAFMKDPLTRPLVSDFQTRALSATFDPLALASSDVHDGSQFWLEQHLETSPSGFPEDVDLARAKQFLVNCVFVGIVERMEDSVRLLAKILRIDSAGPPRLSNVDAGRSENRWSDEELALALELNRADRELYAFAVELFDRQRLSLG